MLAAELKRASQELTEHKNQLNALRNLLRFGTLVDSHTTAQLIAREIHETAWRIQGASNQLELIPPQKGEQPAPPLTRRQENT